MGGTGRSAGLDLAPGTRGTTDVLHDHLRARILSGDLVAGSELSQAAIAKEVGTSRAPVREAFRLLQREGLIEVAINQRARVTPLSLADVEHAYAMRITGESLALSVTIPRLSAEDLAEMDRRLAAIEAADPTDFEAWDRDHQRFHAMLRLHAGAAAGRSLDRWADHTRRYRRAYVADSGGGWLVGAGEHALMARACRDRDVEAGAALLARHLARAGLALVSAIDPAHDPALLRAAVRQVAGGGGGG